MPFNNTPLKADPNTIFDKDRFIAWLEKQPADDKYNFWSNDNCLIGQYIKHLGYSNPYVGLFYVRDGKEGPPISRYDDSIADIAGDRPWTFGAALKRARAIL